MEENKNNNQDYEKMQKDEEYGHKFTCGFIGAILGLCIIPIVVTNLTPEYAPWYIYPIELVILLASPFIGGIIGVGIGSISGKGKAADFVKEQKELDEYNATLQPYRGVTMKKLRGEQWELVIPNSLAHTHDNKVKLGVLQTERSIHELIDMAYNRGWW